MVTYSCSYGFSSLKNKWEAKGVNTIAVPMFTNKTIEGGAEVFFTNSLRQYLVSRSGKLKFVRDNADAVIEGSLKTVTITPGAILFGTPSTESSGGIPSNRMLAASYLLTATIDLRLVRTKDNKELWKTTMVQSRSMDSGTYTDERRSSNSFIKESNKKEALRLLSETMMLYAVDSMLEEF